MIKAQAFYLTFFVLFSGTQAYSDAIPCTHENIYNASDHC